MTETQIKYFLTVAEEQSFSRAAQKLYVSQPAVSKIISQLENELGFMLFDRTRKHFKLTDECEMFRDFVLRCYEDYQQTMENIRIHRSGFSGCVRIGIVDSWSTTQFYDEIVTYFAAVHPNIELRVEAYGVDAMLEALRRGEIDVGITFGFIVSNQKDIASKPFVALEAGFLYAENGEGPKRTLKDFQDMSFILKVEGTERVRKLITELCRSEGFEPKFHNSKGAGYEITEVRHGNCALFCCEWHFWKESGLFQYFPMDYRLPTKLIYIQEREINAKSIFVNEVEMLFADRIEQSMQRPVLHGSA
ncbi:MAG: LysR family transcriptional regulator [Oscillospiraceae bacterium]|nr:LysR family transcriptional regulator [Oscillospiraceae bacterium]